MNYLMLALKIFATLVLVILAIYSWVYFSQVRKIERQLGLRLPIAIKRILAVLAMVPMFISLIVIIIVFVEMGV